MIVALVVWLFSGLVYGLSLDALHKAAARATGHSEKTLPELLEVGPREIPTEMNARATRRLSLILEPSKDPDVERARRNVLGSWLLAGVVLIGTVPLSGLVDASGIVKQVSLWTGAALAALGIAFVWLVVFVRSVFERPRYMGKLAISCAAVVVSTAVFSAITSLATR